MTDVIDEWKKRLKNTPPLYMLDKLRGEERKRKKKANKPKKPRKPPKGQKYGRRNTDPRYECLYIGKNEGGRNQYGMWEIHGKIFTWKARCWECPHLQKDL